MEEVHSRWFTCEGVDHSFDEKGFEQTTHLTFREGVGTIHFTLDKRESDRLSLRAEVGRVYVVTFSLCPPEILSVIDPINSIEADCRVGEVRRMLT